MTLARERLGLWGTRAKQHLVDRYTPLAAPRGRRGFIGRGERRCTNRCKFA